MLLNTMQISINLGIKIIESLHSKLPLFCLLFGYICVYNFSKYRTHGMEICS